MRKKLTGFALILLTMCLMTGCLFNVPLDHLDKDDIKGEVTYDFRAGTEASKLVKTVDTDATFDMDKFIELYNADQWYDPIFYQYHLDKLDLRIIREEDPEEFEKIAASEVCITVHFDGLNRSVSIFRYESKMYFFILCMGGGTRPDDIGYYYDEVPKELAEYWDPICDEVFEDQAKNNG